LIHGRDALGHGDSPAEQRTPDMIVDAERT